MYARMLTFCVTAIIYYIIINSEFVFIKSTNMIYHNCVHTERNTWYILTHLGESGYYLQMSTNYQVNWPNCSKFLGQWPRSKWNQQRWKSQFTLQPATQFTVLYHWEVSVRISTLTLLFHGNLSYFLFILHCYERIYIHHVGYVCSVRISIVV